MPNWCSTRYAFYATDKEHQDELYRFCDVVESVKNDFGKRWLGNVCTAFGINYKDVSCRGDIDCIYEDEDYIIIDTDTAWEPMPEMWDIILNKHFPHLKYAYYAEEPYMNIYVKHDDIGYFTEKFVFDGYSNDVGERISLDTEEELVYYANQIFSKMYGSEFVVPEEVYAFSEELNSQGGDAYLNIHEIEEV